MCDIWPISIRAWTWMILSNILYFKLLSLFDVKSFELQKIEFFLLKLPSLSSIHRTKNRIWLSHSQKPHIKNTYKSIVKNVCTFIADIPKNWMRMNICAIAIWWCFFCDIQNVVPFRDYVFVCARIVQNEGKNLLRLKNDCVKIADTISKIRVYTKIIGPC